MINYGSRLHAATDAPRRRKPGFLGSITANVEGLAASRQPRSDGSATNVPPFRWQSSRMRIANRADDSSSPLATS
jgi:hypothetical protein